MEYSYRKFSIEHVQWGSWASQFSSISATRSLHNSRRRKDPVVAFRRRVGLEHDVLGCNLGNCDQHKLVGQERSGQITGDPLVDLHGCKYLLGHHLLPTSPLLLLLIAHHRL